MVNKASDNTKNGILSETICMNGKIVLFILILTLGLGFYLLQRPEAIVFDPVPEATSTPTVPISPTSQTQTGGIKSSWIIVRNMDKISLLSNIVERLSASEAKEKYGCTAIINGGFYSADESGENAKHIGLFISNGNQISPSQTNTLFNGFFSISGTTPSISSTVPPNVKTALQTGPVLMKNGKASLLTLARDEDARRMIAATTPQNEVIFLALYDPSSFFNGPKLEEVPKILSDIDKSTSLDFKDAINLDGGSHSAFISEEISLTDVQTPGSYFCVKN
jgi:uncharacterized protein YigE (DUF2233 family)